MQQAVNIQKKLFMVDSHIQTFSSSVLSEIYFITLFMARQRMGVKLDVATLFIIRDLKSLQFLRESTKRELWISIYSYF